MSSIPSSANFGSPFARLSQVSLAVNMQAKGQNGLLVKSVGSSLGTHQKRKKMPHTTQQNRPAGDPHTSQLPALAPTTCDTCVKFSDVSLLLQRCNGSRIESEGSTRRSSSSAESSSSSSWPLGPPSRTIKRALSMLLKPDRRNPLRVASSC